MFDFQSVIWSLTMLIVAAVWVLPDAYRRRR
jgi:hypothetical protein